MNSLIAIHIYMFPSSTHSPQKFGYCLSPILGLWQPSLNKQSKLSCRFTLFVIAIYWIYVCSINMNSPGSLLQSFRINKVKEQMRTFLYRAEIFSEFLMIIKLTWQMMKNYLFLNSWKEMLAFRLFTNSVVILRKQKVLSYSTMKITIPFILGLLFENLITADYWYCIENFWNALSRHKTLCIVVAVSWFLFICIN